MKLLRKTLDARGFDKVYIHAFDNWPKDKFNFIKDLAADPEARNAVAYFGAHVLNSYDPKATPASEDVQQMAAQMKKPIWNTEEHVYKKGFDCAISIVQAFNDNFITSGATKIVNWYDIAGLYPTQPYAEDPAMILAHSPWSGHYSVRENLWGYAHYGQFTAVGWSYLTAACTKLPAGGSIIAMKSPGNDYSLIVETKDAKTPQRVRIELPSGSPLSKNDLSVWRSTEKELFTQQPSLKPADNAFSFTLEPNAIYSLSTTTGQQKGSFVDIPAATPFPFPYRDTFDTYPAKAHGYLPRYTADIAGAFELVDHPDGKGGQCLRQVVPLPTISWAPDWLPYTILGDAAWTDYDVSADVRLNLGDTAGVMGRINHVGTGYGFIPKGYFAQLSDAGVLRLICIRGKVDKKKSVGDAEQQALIAAGKDEGEGGEKLLASAKVPNIAPNQWHNLKLRFQGTKITVLVDDAPALSATDNLYSAGMAGLMTSNANRKLSTPYFDNLQISAPTARTPETDSPPPSNKPIYPP